eukprot:308696_1
MASQTTDQETQIEDSTTKDNQQTHANIDNPIDNNNEPKESDNLTVEVDDEEKKFDLNRTPSIMRQLTNINDRGNRCNTTLLNLNESDVKEIDEKEEIFEYGFGAPFSYWPQYTYYPYIAANHKSLKIELLNNKISPITMDEWNQVTIKAQTSHTNIQNILGIGKDKNTPYAHYNEQFNEIFKIKHKQLISIPHIQSILFFTDFSNLPRDMRKCCMKMKQNETIDDVKKRHAELVNWLKLLFETIVMYGGNYSTNDKPLYHGLNRKFYFKEFKAKFYIPLSGSTEKSTAQDFSEGVGMILEFGGLNTFNVPYFDTASLSAYPNEKEYLFFFAELPIKSIYIHTKTFDMAPLRLYESIVLGNIIIEKAHLRKKQYNKAQGKLNKYLNIISLKNNQDMEKEMDKLDKVEQYGINLLKRFIKHNKTVWINKDEIIRKITMGKLREKFIEQNEDKSFKNYSTSLLELNDELEIKNADKFIWKSERYAIEKFLGEDGYCCSPILRCSDRAKFYCQMNRMDDENGRISLILHKLPEKKKRKTISFNICCKHLDKYYMRFHNITFKLHGEEDDARQGADFKLKWIQKAYDKKKNIEWKITISE